MRIRKRYLPPGWYPGTAKHAREAIEQMAASIGDFPRSAVAGVAPHAGWEFSGRLALEVFSRISRTMDTIVIIGGHLAPADGILFAFEEAYETPLGAITADIELLEAIKRSMPMREDRYADNTVEIQLPFLRQVFPQARALGLRAPPSMEARSLGAAIAEAARSIGRRLAVIGSTDLTHYGPNYGFLPVGSGDRALSWVREVNDRRFIESLVSMDAEAAIDQAVRERSACSAGGAVAAMSFAHANGVAKGTLVRYMTSLEVHPSDSFVGYAGIIYEGGFQGRA